MTNTKLSLTAALAAVLLAGCSSAPNPSPAAPTRAPIAATTATSAASPSAVARTGPVGAGDSQADILDKIATEYGVSPRPSVKPIRTASPADRDALIDECMTGEGFTRTEGTFRVPQAQKQAFGRAMYTCWAKYPIDPKYDAPLDQAKRTKLYHYWVDVRTPCLRKLGYQIPDPPTLESWLGGHDWAPHYYTPDITPAEEKQCPSEPADLYDS